MRCSSAIHSIQVNKDETPGLSRELFTLPRRICRRSRRGGRRGSTPSVFKEPNATNIFVKSHPSRVFLEERTLSRDTIGTCAGIVRPFTNRRPPMIEIWTPSWRIKPQWRWIRCVLLRRTPSEIRWMISFNSSPLQGEEMTGSSVPSGNLAHCTSACSKVFFCKCFQRCWDVWFSPPRSSCECKWIDSSTSCVHFCPLFDTVNELHNRQGFDGAWWSQIEQKLLWELLAIRCFFIENI